VLLRSSQKLCVEADDLTKATRALRATSVSIRGALSILSIRGGVDTPDAEAPRCSRRFPLIGLPEAQERRCPSCQRQDVASRIS